METKRKIWSVTFTTHDDEKSSHSVVVALCTQCLGILGALASETATKENKEKSNGLGR